MRSSSFRLGALVAAGVVLVHEARYRLGAGRPVVDLAAASGHAYVELLAAVSGIALALALGQFVHGWWRRSGEASEPTIGRLRLALLAAAAVLGGYAGQELVAGLVSPGHPVGVAGLLEAGGWIALPLALATGAAIAATVRTATAVLRRRCASASSAPRRSTVVLVWRSSSRAWAVSAAFARNLGGRSPPPAPSR